MTARTMPPKTIWRPVATSGRGGRGARCEANSEPLAHGNGDRRQKSRPTGSSAPLPPTIDGAARTATPDEPDGDADDGEARQPLAEEEAAEDATQIGIVAMSRAAIPDGTVCSAKATNPIPPPSSRAPTIALSRSSRRVGMTNARPSRAIDHVSRIRPASRNRAPP